MSVLLVVRHTRAEEESGRAELLLGRRRRPPGAADRRARVAALANTAVAVLVAAGLVGSGLRGRRLGRARPAGIGLAGAGLRRRSPAVTAQLVGPARAASGTALALLGVAVLVRGRRRLRSRAAAGCPGSRRSAWAQQTRAYVGVRWWRWLLLVALAPSRWSSPPRCAWRRDGSGAGLLPPGPGPARGRARLAGPAGCSPRLQRGSVAGWTVGLLRSGSPSARSPTP